MKQVDVFLRVVRLGVGKPAIVQSGEVDWECLKTLADNQGLLGVFIDGIERLTNNIRPRKEFLLEWIGEVLQAYEYRYKTYTKTIAELASWYNAHGYKMMILKGYTCSLDWPKPEHRPCGDIDIWLYGNQQKADDALALDKKIKIDKSHHHHTIFNWRDFTVENHYDFINVHHHRSHKEYEKILKELGQDDSHYIEVYGEKVYLPSPDLNALFLIKHLMLHFASGEVTIRQLLDWAFFVEKHYKEVKWDWLMEVLKDNGMVQAFHIFNAICVEELGFESSLFPQISYYPFLKERVLKEIIHPEFNGVKPRSIIHRAIFRFRRWRANAWKHQLCYNESLWSAFWSGVWSHLLKPSSI